MEADRHSSLPRTGPFCLAEDSFLLSDYLHHQAEKAGNRFFNNVNSLMFLRSKLFSSELERKEADESSDRSYPPEFKSMPLGLSVAHKESSEGFTGRECSLCILSQLETQKANSSLPHAIQGSSDLNTESSDCCESAEIAEVATRIEANSESLHSNMQCHESRQAISLSIDGEEEEGAGNYEDGAADDDSTATLDHTEALNLLVTAAMQVDSYDFVVGTSSLKRAYSPNEGDHRASALHGTNSPILKRKVIRRAKSAFQKHSHNNQSCKVAATRAIEKNSRHILQTRMADLADAQVSRDQALVGRAKGRMLRDLSFGPSNAVAAACTDVHEDVERNQGEVEKEPIKNCGEVEEEISEVENMQVSPAKKVPSSRSTEALKVVVTNNVCFVDHRKLQVSSARLWDACNAEHSIGAQMHSAQRTLRMRPEISLPSSSMQKKSTSKGVTRACTGREEIRSSSMDRLERQEEETCLEIMQFDNTTKSGSSALRLKILPMKLPNADLPLLQESESTEGILEDRMVTRRRKSLLSGEQDKAMVSSEAIVLKEIPTQDSQAIDGDQVIRTKRGRSQILPTKFSDSVLQPWKSFRKKRK